MYRGRLWTMRQYAGFGTAQETNQRFRHLLDAGQTGLHRGDRGLQSLRDVERAGSRKLLDDEEKIAVTIRDESVADERLMILDDRRYGAESQV